MTTDLALLTTAAEQWDAAAKKFESVQKDYESQVKAIASDGTWTGQANLAGKTTMQLTHEQYTAAAKEARAIASLLRDAHGQFTDLRGKLKSAVADAEKAGMKVSEGGIASFDFAKADAATANAARHDPDLHTAEASWTKHVDNVVRAFDDADQGVKLALQAAVQDGTPDLLDGTPHGFNAQAEGDIEKVEAKEAYELATKLTSKGHLDAKEMAEMQRLFRDNDHDKAFSQTFLSGLGADNTIRFTNKLNELGHSSGSDKRDYLMLDKGLSQSLATATQIPPFKTDGKQLEPGSREYFGAYKNWLDSSDGKFYKQWMGDLKTAGVKHYRYEGITDEQRIGEGREQKVRGYQSLVTMMQNGGDYSPQFLHDLTDDMIAAERKDKNLWDLYGPFSKKDTGWFAYDPVDRTLGIMSKNPAAATSYFDPKAQIYDRDANGGEGAYRGNDRFDYLREKRDWAVMNTVDTIGNWEHHGDDIEARDGHKGFGEALRAAATGRAPDTPAMSSHPRHTDTQVRIFEDIVSKYGTYTAVNQSDMPANIRGNMAHVIADYPADVHDILGKGGDARKLELDPSRAKIGTAELQQFIRAASEDGDAFHIIHHSQSTEAAERINKIGRDDFASYHEGSPDVPRGHVTESGRALGALDRIRADVISDHKDSEIFRNNWNAKINYHLIGAPFTLIPYSGDSIQRYVDVGTSEYANRLNDKATAESTKDLIKLYDGGQRELEAMLIDRAKDLDVPMEKLRATGSRGQDLLTEAGFGYADGIGRAGRSTGGVN
ncbi:hypothetical protein [Streptomyces sp. NPDC001678]|uniref:hypothetical protein n=1 Tax=Streptomyces sp. NPDC001678 TaxID=3364599 RepID=UPI0036CAF810